MRLNEISKLSISQRIKEGIIVVKKVRRGWFGYTYNYKYDVTKLFEKEKPMTDDIPDAVWIKNGKLITPVQNSEFAEKYHKSPPVVDVEALRKGNLDPVDNNGHRTYCVEDMGWNKCLDHLIAEGIIQEKKT